MRKRHRAPRTDGALMPGVSVHSMFNSLLESLMRSFCWDKNCGRSGVATPTLAARDRYARGVGLFPRVMIAGDSTNALIIDSRRFRFCRLPKTQLLHLAATVAYRRPPAPETGHPVA